MTLVLLLAAIIVVADQVSKAAALAHLVPGHPLVLSDDWLSLTLVMNPGLAFGLLGTLEPAWRWVVAALSIIALLVLARVALRVLPTGGLAEVIAIGLIFGGAVGNLIDRARFGAVVDFVDVHWHSWHWPAFNVADSAITVGVVIMIFDMLGVRDRAPTS